MTALARPDLRTSRRPPREAQAGHAAGPILFVTVLLAVAVGGYLWLQARQARLEASSSVPGLGERGGRGSVHTTADKWTRRLGVFLQNGPSDGTWETQFLSCVYTQYIAPHPARPDIYVIAQVDADGVRQPVAVSRWLVPRHFFRAPAHLFFSNYVRSEGPIQEKLDDGTPCWRVHWAPRENPDGLTERIVWFTQVGGDVAQVEDRSRTGHLIRRVRRVAKDTGSWRPEDVDMEALTYVEQERPTQTTDPDDTLIALSAKAPFDVYAPAYLPAGFVLVRSTYDVRDASRSPGALTTSVQDAPVQLVSQLYSDGLALISVGVALRRDMDIIETMTAGMVESDDPAGCPGLPADPRIVREDDQVIRMRSDTCRTVLRRDDLGDVSVTIIGRNELPVEEYLRMIGTLRPVTVGSRAPR